MKQFKTGTPWGDAVDALAGIAEQEFGAEYTIEKAAPEWRFTFGPLYSPMVRDAHNEFATSDDLQKTAWAFMEGPRELRKQHTSERIGVVKELVSWPFDHDAKLYVAGRLVKSVTLPAGTVYAGVQWDPAAWTDVKTGKTTGFSMGGTAARIRNAVDDADLIKFS